MDKKVDFGFKEVESSEKETLVGKVFSSVAGKYDLMNDVMSFGLHRLWKKRMLEELEPNKSLLDMASGTGDIAKKYYQKSSKANITLSDINYDMLSKGRNNLIDDGMFKGLKFVCSNAEILPFSDLSFDYYTIAFGIRNVTDKAKALKEAWRVLKPGGKFICLEFAKVSNPILSSIYDFYSMNIIPQMGNLIAGDKNSYKYLVESIRTFPSQNNFTQMMNEAGFKINKFENLTNGVVALYTGYRV